MPYDGYKSLEILRQGTSGLAQSIAQAGEARRERSKINLAKAELEEKRMDKKRELAGAAQVAENLADVMQLPQTEFAKRESVLTPLQQKAQFVINQIYNPDPNVRKQGKEEAIKIVNEQYIQPAEDRFKKLDNEVLNLQIAAQEAEDEGNLEQKNSLEKKAENLAKIRDNHLATRTRLKSRAMNSPMQIVLTKIAAKQQLTEGEEALAARYYAGALQDLSKSGTPTNRIYDNAINFIRKQVGYEKPLPGNSIGQPPLSNQQPGTEKRKLTGAEIAAEYAKIQQEDDPNLRVISPQIPQLDESDLEE